MKFKTIFLAIILVFFTALNINAQSWTQIGDTFYGENAGDKLGSSIALNYDGSVVAVGATDWAFEGVEYGKVQVFSNNNGTWEQLGQDIQGTINSECGYSVALNNEGNILAVGSQRHFIPGIGSVGSVDVYLYNQDTELWEQIGQKLIGNAAYDNFSYSISLNSQGNRVVISAPWNDLNAQNAGLVRVFEYNETNQLWEQLGADFLGESEDDRIGTEVDINAEGNIIGIGAHFYSAGKANMGQVKLYEFDETLTEWVQIGQDLYGQSSGDHFGQSISLDQTGNTVIIGAPSVGSAGEIRVYELLTDTWTQVGNEITGGQYDYLGTKVSISDDASKIVFSSYYSTDAKGFVKVYEKIDDSWVQFGNTIWGDDTNDNFGTQIAFSNNANVVAGGSINDDDNGEQAGQVKVFSCVCENLPTPDLAELPEITDDCSIDISTYTPTATSDCGLTIYGTTSQLIFNEQGTHTITWTYDDGFANIATQEQTLIINDITNPEIPTIDDITNECSVAVTYTPTTTDNCAGEITGTTTDPLEYTELGTYIITWTFDDNNGNFVQAEQAVFVTDDTPPEISCPLNQEVNADENHFYTVQDTQFDPVETFDNCNIMSITNDYNNSETLAGEQLPEGTSTITWTITDFAGNQTGCSFDVTVNEFVGIDENINNYISVYPNPTTSFVNIEAENIDIQTIKVVDVYGQKIDVQTNKKSSTIKVDFSSQASGVYFLKVETKEGIITKKVIIK